MKIYKRITVIIPAYNEEKKIAWAINKIETYLYTKKWDYQIYVVDDGSRDRTRLEAQTYKEKSKTQRIHIVSYSQNKGKGGAVHAGVSEAKRNHPIHDILFLDADLSTPIETVERINTKNRKAIRIGNRNHPQSQILKKQGFIRNNLGKMFPNLVNSILGLDLPDTQCGFKYFPYETTWIFNHQTITGFAFDVELLFIALYNKIDIISMPVQWENDTDSKVRTFRHGLQMLMSILRIRAQYSMGKYKQEIHEQTKPKTYY